MSSKVACLWGRCLALDDHDFPQANVSCPRRPCLTPGDPSLPPNVPCPRRPRLAFDLRVRRMALRIYVGNLTAARKSGIPIILYRTIVVTLRTDRGGFPRPLDNPLCFCLRRYGRRIFRRELFSTENRFDQKIVLSKLCSAENFFHGKLFDQKLFRPNNISAEKTFARNFETFFD